MIPADPWAGFGPATILRSDALALPIADATVDLVVTSPPYFALRSYQDGGQHYNGQIGSEATPDEFVSTLLDATREMVRVLKPSGSLWVNLGDKYAGSRMDGSSDNGTGSTTLSGTASIRERSAARGYGATRAANVPAKSLIGVPWRYALRCIDELGLILRAEVIWSKPNGLPESVTDRVRRSHEQWFHMVKSPRYFAAVDEIREGIDTTRRPGLTYAERMAGKGRIYGEYDGQRHGHTSGGDGMAANPLGKLPGSVREVPSAPLKVPPHLGVDHFAAFPPAWPAWIIRGWSPTGVCVECGEGRRPVTDVQYTVDKRGVPGGTAIAGRHNQPSWGGSSIATITGYACACPTPDAPTRPAVVLDPFGGTGTTAMAARALGRHGITVDLSADYCRLARWRVQDGDELATVRGLPRQQRVNDNEPTLLDLLDDEVPA